MWIRLAIPEVGEDTLALALSSLQGIDEVWLHRHPETPLLYHSGVVYAPELATEEWLPIPYLLARGIGDCEDLAAWRAAELRVTGEDPDARAMAYRSRPNLWHTIVRRGDGTIEDPSLALGMRVHPGILMPGSFLYGLS